MPATEALFATQIYSARPLGRTAERLRADLARACFAFAEGDVAGQAWCAAHGYRGYTSYASLNDLPWRDPVIAELVTMLDTHVARFAVALNYDLGRRPLVLDSLWVNVLEPGGMHAGHIHPGSVVSGTYYVAMPDGAPGLKFEDPRLAQMMAAPPRRTGAARANRSFVEFSPRPGTLLLWESYLRHEVPATRTEAIPGKRKGTPVGGGAGDQRISISFNYGWPPLPQA